MNPTDYRLRLTWRWSIRAAPGQRALSGLRILLRYLGLRTARVSQGATSCALLLTPAARHGPSEEEARGHLEAWEKRVLGAYPGSSWRVEPAPPSGQRAA